MIRLVQNNFKHTETFNDLTEEQAVFLALVYSGQEYNLNEDDITKISINYKQPIGF